MGDQNMDENELDEVVDEMMSDDFMFEDWGGLQDYLDEQADGLSG